MVSCKQVWPSASNPHPSTVQTQVTKGLNLAMTRHPSESTSVCHAQPSPSGADLQCLKTVYAKVQVKPVNPLTIGLAPPLPIQIIASTHIKVTLGTRAKARSCTNPKAFLILTANAFSLVPPDTRVETLSQRRQSQNRDLRYSNAFDVAAICFLSLLCSFVVSFM